MTALTLGSLRFTVVYTVSRVRHSQEAVPVTTEITVAVYTGGHYRYGFSWFLYNGPYRFYMV